MTTRVGVVADTHCPEFIDRLPERLLSALQGVDLILHAGDITATSTLDELARIAPVQAVRGDHDRNLESLPATREIALEGKRVVIVHGQRPRWLEESQTFWWTVSLGFFQPHRGGADGVFQLGVRAEGEGDAVVQSRRGPSMEPNHGHAPACPTSRLV